MPPLHSDDPVNETSIVAEVLRSQPASLAVFLKRRMYCPGCQMAAFMTLAEAAESHGLEVSDLLRDLRAARAEG
jgi:hybrid cluster-associated redox disulfide protein